ncbi:MAG: hypothetical protein V1702_00770 [Candidatus Woesearchaeota archaeon]
MKNPLLLTIIALSIFISGCANNTTFNDREINNPKIVELPIDSINEAIQYSLSLDQVKSELNKPLEGNMAQYNKYDWWATAFNQYEYYNNSERYKDSNYWIVNWFKGPSACESLHGCQIIISTNGTIISNLSCSDGWNCE